MGFMDYKVANAFLNSIEKGIFWYTINWLQPSCSKQRGKE